MLYRGFADLADFNLLPAGFHFVEQLDTAPFADRTIAPAPGGQFP
jgi:hypothetical protein